MSTDLIKELRVRTGAGILDCKKALEATKNDIDQAIVWLQDRGAAKAAKKAGAIAAEGVVSIMRDEDTVVIFELNSQTDFVAKTKEFQDLVKTIGQTLLTADFSNAIEANAALVHDSKTIGDLVIEATAKIGEKINLRRAQKVMVEDGQAVGAYTHVTKQVAAILITEGGSDDIARNVAMHIASMNPEYLDEKDIASDIIQSFKDEIDNSDALKGKPEKVKESIAKGMLRKKLSDLTLVDQEFVMEKMTVRKYLDTHKAVARLMYRLEVGEGIDKKEQDFADEVASQMR